MSLAQIKAEIAALSNTNYSCNDFTIEGGKVKSILNDLVAYLEQVDGVARRVPADEVSQGTSESNG